MASTTNAKIGVMLGVLLVYAGVLVGGPYGYNDDYQYLQRVYVGAFDPAHNEQIGMGRPIASWMIEAAYSLCSGSVRNLVYLRLMTLVGIACFSLTLYRTLRQAGQSGKSALAVAASVALSPACGVYAAWAAAFPIPYALTCCLLAGSLLEPLAPDPAHRWRRRAGAALLIVLSCCAWQEAAPMSLVAGFAGMWRRIKGGASLRTAVRSGGVLLAWTVVAASVIVYLAGQWLAVRLGWVRGLGLDRMALTTDIQAKFLLLGDLLRSGISSWSRLHSLAWEFPLAGLTLLAAVAAIVGPLTSGKWLVGRIGARTLLAACMLLASVGPLLTASENNAAFRSLPVLYTVVAFLAVEGISSCRSKTHSWVGTTACASLILIMGVSSAYHVQAGIVAPNVQEYRAVSRLVRRQFTHMPSQLVYLTPPTLLLAPETMKPSWEYGLVSSSYWWVTRPFLLLIFHEQGMCAEPKLDRLQIVYREAGNKDLPVLNPMGAMLHETGVWREDPRWGQVLAFSRGWLYSPWFGYLNVRNFPAIEHHLMKSMLYVGSQPDDLWLFKGGLGIFLTSKASFPSLYVNDHKVWGYLLDTDFAHVAVRLPSGLELLLSGRVGRDAMRIEAGGALNLDAGVNVAYNTAAGRAFTLVSANTSIDYPDGTGPFDGLGVPSMDGWSRPGVVSPSIGNGPPASTPNALATGSAVVFLPVIPEPSAWVLVLLGGAGLLVVMMRRPLSSGLHATRLRQPGHFGEGQHVFSAPEPETPGTTPNAGSGRRR